MTNQDRTQAQMLGRPPYPSGVPLTDSMEFTDRDGARWLAYIEGIPLPRARFWSQPAGFPGRRLRFDSAAGSRVATPVPAGSPFLTDARLQQLLDRSDLVDAIIAPTPASAGPGRRLVESAGRSARHAAAVLTETARHWRQLGAGVADGLIVWVARLLGGQPRARF